MMGGWKTWIAAIGMFCGGIALMVEGFMAEPRDPNKIWEGLMVCSAALGMVGIGHKIEKSS